MSSALYGLTGRQDFLPDAVVAQFGRAFSVQTAPGLVNQVGADGDILKLAFRLDAGSSPALRFMPGDTDTGDTIFDSEENLEMGKKEEVKHS